MAQVWGGSREEAPGQVIPGGKVPATPRDAPALPGLREEPRAARPPNISDGRLRPARLPRAGLGGGDPARPGFALPGCLPARPLGARGHGAPRLPEGGLRAARCAGPGRCKARASERASGAGRRGCVCAETAREREPPAREGWVGERRRPQEERPGNRRPAGLAGRSRGGEGGAPRAETGPRKGGGRGARPRGGAPGPGEDKSVLGGVRAGAREGRGT